VNRRQAITSAVALLGAGAGAGLWLWRSGTQGVDTAAAFWGMTFERPEGGELDMASLRGGPLLLNFWATWCAPCIKEMPLLDQFHRSQQARGWHVVGMAIDSRAPVREYLERLPMSFPITLAGPGGVALTRAFGNSHGNLPFSVVFDRAGRVMATKLGAVDPSELEQWKREAG
jgi:thiol-disulfide isomerase/thioredoxin